MAAGTLAEGHGGHRPPYGESVILSVAKDLAVRRGQILRYAQDDKCWLCPA